MDTVLFVLHIRGLNPLLVFYFRVEEKFARGKFRWRKISRNSIRSGYYFRGRKISRKIKIRENSEHLLHAKTWCYLLYSRCLPSPLPRTIFGISWRDHATHGEVMRRTGMERLQDIVSTRRRKMAGHVLRLQGERPAHTAMYWVREDDRRKRGRPMKTWRSTFKEDLEEMGVSWHGARRIASDRERWRLLVARCSERYRRI